VVTEPSRLSPAQVQGTFAALEEVGDMGSRVKQATVLTVVAATFASAMYGIALAHGNVRMIADFREEGHHTPR